MGRRGSQPHRHRQPFQVLLADQAKACALDERCTETPFPERATALVTGVEAAHVLTAQRLHDSGQGPLLARRDEQMHPVGQQQPRMQRGALLTGRLTQDLTKRLAILVVDEHRLVVVATQQDVMELTGQDQARSAGHRFIPAASGVEVRHAASQNWARHYGQGPSGGRSGQPTHSSTALARASPPA